MNSARFYFLGCSYENGVARLRYRLDSDGLTLADGAQAPPFSQVFEERVRFPGAPAQLAPEREAGVAAALKLLHWIAGVSYYKCAPGEVVLEDGPLDAATADLLEAVYSHGLAEFAHQNQLQLNVQFPRAARPLAAPVSVANLPRRALVPIGGGKDSLVSIEALKRCSEPCAAVWIGNSELIRACASATGLPLLNIARELSPALFELNARGALNGHIPVTAINSAILVLAALVYGYDSVVFSNEASADIATLHGAHGAVNHQWSKSWAFEQAFAELVRTRVASDLHYFSLLRPYSELAITRKFASLSGYDTLFSSCNRNFRILGDKPSARWCGQCPKCHFVFLALAPFMSKPRLLHIFGRNFLDQLDLAAKFDALLEWGGAHKPFECVGEARESRAAFYALSQRADWQEDALIVRFAKEILPRLSAEVLDLDALSLPQARGLVPLHLRFCVDQL